MSQTPTPRAPRRRSRAERRAPLLPGEGPLARVPALVAFLGVLVVFVVAVFLGGVVGAVLLGVLALGVAGLLAATWGGLSPAERGGRALVLAALVAVALAQVLR